MATAPFAAPRPWTPQPDRDQRVVAFTALFAGAAIGVSGIVGHSPPLILLGGLLLSLIGAVYYALFQRRKPAHMQAPEGEALLAEPPPAPVAAT